MISVGDSGGIGGPHTENGENVQNAHLIMIADCKIQQGDQAKASPVTWRSTRCKRAVNSTFAGETIKDVLDHSVTTRDSTRATLPFQVVLRSDCTLSSRLPHDHSSDAKSVFDALMKECAGSRQDRRAAVDLAIVRETLKAQDSRIRWIPHLLIPADAMTKVDPSAANDALRHLLRTGMWVWDEERIRQGAGLGRSNAVSRRQLVVNETRG